MDSLIDCGQALVPSVVDALIDYLLSWAFRFQNIGKVRNSAIISRKYADEKIF